MARGGAPSEVSRLARRKIVAYAKKTKGSGESGDSADEPDDGAKAPDGKPIEIGAHDGHPKPGEGAKSAHANQVASDPIPTPEVATPAPAPAAAQGPSMFSRSKGETMGMPPNLMMGSAPDMPVEDPTNLPDPKAIPTGEASSPAAPPGRVPAGDSRSLRKDSEFALIYRRTTFIITRVGTVGTLGQWRVVEYPTSPMASNAYARECSRFVADGFSDYR
jgi:hypothetical protein